MFDGPATWRHRARLVLILLVTWATSACDGILGSNDAAFARNARVMVTNESGFPVLLVRSTRFVRFVDPLTGEETVTLTMADTTTISGASFDETTDIFGADRFLASVVSRDSTRTATIHLRVQLDEREVYSQRATLRDASLTYASFYGR